MNNKDQINSFVEGIKNNNLPQTFLISGTYGAGQLYFVDRVLENILPKNYLKTNKMSVSLNNEKSKIEKYEVEKAKIFLEQSPLIGDKKVLIIYDADFLSLESQNLILKSIEEPKKSSIIFLVSNYNNLLNTIKSRSHSVKIKPSLEIKDLRMGFIDIELDSLKQKFIDYLEIYNQLLVFKNKYIERISNLSYKELGDIIWVYESVYRLVYLYYIDNSLYLKYLSEYILDYDLQVLIKNFVKQNNHIYSLKKLEQIQIIKEKIFFTNAKKSLLLEKIIF